MTFFSLDTSTRAGSMALWRDGDAATGVNTHAVTGVSIHAVTGVSIHAVTGVSINDTRSHAERQPLEAVTWLASRGLTLRDIDVFVVVAGPGSFTGLRVGIAAVQGWAFATGRPVAAVPTLNALVASMGDLPASHAIVVPCLDALRGEVFYGAWRGDVELIGASVGTPAEVLSVIAAASAGVPVLIAGDGATKYAADWTTAGWQLTVPTMTLAEAAVRIAAAGDVTPGAPHAARPMYVRRTDAEIVRDRARRSAGLAE